MKFSLGELKKSLLGTVPKSVAPLIKGNTSAEKHLANIFRVVVQNFRATLADSRFEVLVPRLNQIEPELRGFAYEGAGMGLALLDHFLPWKKRLPAFLAGPGSPYIYPVYVGAGLALARVGKKPESYLARLDPVTGWFLLDGYGFRGSIFAYQEYVEKQTVATHLSIPARHLSDQGMGRGLWFLCGGNIDRIAAKVTSFSEDRQADLWGGVGFACAYAGGVDREAIEQLRIKADVYRPQLARGAAIAAKARQRAGILTHHTDVACEVLCGLSSHMAAHLTDVALQDLPTSGPQSAYEIWRQRIESDFAVSSAREIELLPHLAQ